MKRWFQWQFVLPRALGVVVALLAVQYLLGVVARSVATQAGESAIGAGFHVGHARVSLMGRRILFSGLRIADPDRPSQNALEADYCELKFEAGPALKKQVVIESGHLSGVRLDCIADSTNQPERVTPAKPSADWIRKDADLAARKWLDRLNSQFTLDAVKNFDSVTRTETFCSNWSRCSAGLASNLKNLDGRAAALQKAIELAEANPLRNEKMLPELRKQAAALQKEFAEFSTDVDKLPDVLEKERRSIVAARRRDDAAVGSRLQLDAIEANSLSTYLLRDEAARQLDQLVACVNWMREIAPAGARPAAIASRGEDILFTGSRPEPGILIRSLHLNGTTRVAGQPIEFRGSLSNVSSIPQLHKEPMRLHLVGNGSMPLELKATIDRTGIVPRDELLVECHGVMLRQMALGNADQLGIVVAPSIGAVSVSVVVEGNKLNGDVRILQQKVQIAPARASVRNETLNAAMVETLAQVNSMATRLTIGGTVERPTCALSSNLGAAVAEATQRAVRRAGDLHAKALLVEAGRRVDERLAEVDRQMAEQQSQFARTSTVIAARLEKISTEESPRYRLSSEKGGRRLPSNSLFR